MSSHWFNMKILFFCDLQLESLNFRIWQASILKPSSTSSVSVAVKNRKGTMTFAKGPTDSLVTTCLSLASLELCHLLRPVCVHCQPVDDCLTPLRLTPYSCSRVSMIWSTFGGGEDFILIFFISLIPKSWDTTFKKYLKFSVLKSWATCFQALVRLLSWNIISYTKRWWLRFLVRAHTQVLGLTPGWGGSGRYLTDASLSHQCSISLPSL